MPDFRFVSSKPTAQPSSGYATRIPSTEWQKYEALIRRLHASGTIRDEILRILVSEHDFHPSAGQLRDQLARWELRSSRKIRTFSGSGREGISGNSASGSDGIPDRQPGSSHEVYPSTYTTVLDECFNSFWSQYEMGNLQYDTAIEMEIIADTLFLAGRYVAAFNLYSSIYYAVPFCHRYYDKAELSTARCRALVGCLRSSGNLQQLQQIVAIIENEIPSFSRSHLCKPENINIPRGRYNPGGPLMIRFHARESFRYAMSAMDNSSTVCDVIRCLQMEEGHIAALQWYFGRLTTMSFVSSYNEQLRRSGSGLANWTYGGAQSSIYWYLVLDVMNRVEDDHPSISIRHISGLRYTFSASETLSLVAAMVSSEPWLFSLDEMPLDGLRNWTRTLLQDTTLFETIFQQAIKTVMVPNFAIRMNKTKSDMLAVASGYPSYDMPSLNVLKSLTNRMGRSMATDLLPGQGPDEMDIDTAGDFFLDASKPTFESLLWEYSSIIRSYINENCAYQTISRSYDKACIPSQVTPPTAAAPHRTSSASGQHLTGPGDPTLTTSMRGSTRSSFRSFQSTHSRTKRVGSKLSGLYSSKIRSTESSNHGRQFPLPLGIK